MSLRDRVEYRRIERRTLRGETVGFRAMEDALTEHLLPIVFSKADVLIFEHFNPSKRKNLFSTIGGLGVASIEQTQAKWGGATAEIRIVSTVFSLLPNGSPPDELQVAAPYSYYGLLSPAIIDHFVGLGHELRRDNAWVGVRFGLNPDAVPGSLPS